MNTDSRTSARKILRCHATVLFRDAPPLIARTIDVSAAGISILMPCQMPNGQLCKVMFETPINGSVRKVSAVAKVIYSVCSGTEGFRTGFQFTQVDAASQQALAALMA